MASEISSRKAHHLELCATDSVAFKGKGTLLDQVDFLHDPLPEVHVQNLDTSATVMGRKIRAPILIAAMSGGTEYAVGLNRDLATVAEEMGLAMGLGSQRPLLVEGRETAGFFLRDVAPSILLLGNLGAVQAHRLSTERIRDLVREVGADALCLHLNPAQERFQEGGDQDFVGCLEALRRLSGDLGVPVIAKETGCGFSRRAALRVREAGVGWIDVSGAGGTSWVGVETLRADEQTRRGGEIFWDWGVPTAASLAQLSGLEMGVIATGGIRHGLDVARAVALGARMVGLARPFLQAHRAGGIDGVRSFAMALVEGLKTAMLLTGSRNLQDLQEAPLVLGRNLQGWIPAGSPLKTRVVNGG